MHVLIIGASRGIGFEFVKQYLAEGHTVTATARDDASLGRLDALGAKAVRLDVLDAASSAALGRKLGDAKFDVAIVNAGVYGADIAAPTAPTQDEFDFVMRTNVLGPMRVLPALTETLKQGAKMAVISSRTPWDARKLTPDRSTMVSRPGGTMLSSTRDCMASTAAVSRRPRRLSLIASPIGVRSNSNGAAPRVGRA